MASDAAKSKTLEQKRFFRARMTFRQSLMVTGALRRCIEIGLRECDIRDSCWWFISQQGYDSAHTKR